MVPAIGTLRQAILNDLAEETVQRYGYESHLHLWIPQGIDVTMSAQ